MKNTSLSPVNIFGGLMDDWFNDDKTPRFFHDDFFNRGWHKEYQSVPVNIKETEDGYQMEIVAPGLKKEDLKVNVNDNVLHVSFEKTEKNKVEKDDEGVEVLREEYSKQSFKRSFRLSEKVDAEKISGKYEDGILHVEVPKKEKVKAANKTIEIA